MPLPRCFFNISINGVATGRIVFELFSDVVPKTTENFRCLCTGEKGEGKNTFKPLHYQGTPIHRIVKGFIIQGGDFSNGDGTGGESIYGGMFKDEGFHYKHDKPFLLSMANKGPNTNGSQFFLTTRPAPHLDDIHVVFGHVIQGQQYVIEMENQKVDTNHRPYADVRIINSGELVRLVKGKKNKKKAKVVSSSESSESESSEDSDSESESEESSEDEKAKRKRRRKKKRETKKKISQKDKKRKKRQTSKETKGKHKKSKRKRKESTSSESGSESNQMSEGTEDDHVTSTVADDETSLPPDIKDKTSWLYRRTSPSREATKNKKSSSTKKDTIFKSRKKEEVSLSGRKLKGRGNMRYKTPPRQFGSGDHRRDEQRRWRRDRSRSRSRERERRHHDNRSRRRYSPSPPPPKRQRRSHSPDTTSRRDRDRGDGVSPGRDRSDRRNDDKGRRSNSKERDRDKESRRDVESRRVHHGSESGEYSGDSPVRSNRDRDSSKERNRRRRQSPSPRDRGIRKRSPSPRDRGTRGRYKEQSRRDASPAQEVTSKWARHRDKVESSSDEEDEELERAYLGQDKEEEEEDLFGLGKLSREMLQ